MNRRDILKLIPCIPAAVIRQRPDLYDHVNKRAKEIADSLHHQPIADLPYILGDVIARLEVLEQNQSSFLR